MVSERRACAALGHYRSTQARTPQTTDDEAALMADIVELARTYGRYGYRRIHEMLKTVGWDVNVKRVARIWRREGLKVPMKQPKRGRLWLNDGSCVRLRAERRNHVWAYDFVEERTHDNRKIRMLCVVDEFTREALAIRVARRLNSSDVIDALADLMITRGAPEHVRSDNVLHADASPKSDRGSRPATLRRRARVRQSPRDFRVEGKAHGHSKHRIHAP